MHSEADGKLRSRTWRPALLRRNANFDRLRTLSAVSRLVANDMNDGVDAKPQTAWTEGRVHCYDDDDDGFADATILRTCELCRSLPDCCYCGPHATSSSFGSEASTLLNCTHAAPFFRHRPWPKWTDDDSEGAFGSGIFAVFAHRKLGRRARARGE